MSLIRQPEGWRQKFLVAVQKGDADEAERLILQFKSAGRANPTKKPNDQGLYPIHLAAAQGSVSVCELLVRYGANVNQATLISGAAADKRTCLHFAAMAGKVGCMKYLISAGADPHAIDAFGKKPYGLCQDEATKRSLLISMESWNNVLVAGDLLNKATMAQVLVLKQPDTSIDSLHPGRLVATYDSWQNELEKIREQNNVHIPMSPTPKPSFLRMSRNNLKMGLYCVVDRRQEAETKNVFGGIFHARSIKYLGEDAIFIEAFFVRKDMRRKRMGTLLMYHLLTTFARAQWSHAITSIANSNHAAQSFFRKMGFKAILPDAVPHEFKKPLHTFFEVQYIGLTLARIENFLDHYKDVKIIDDDDHLEEENARVQEARQRRIDAKRDARKNAQNSESGAFFLALERSLGVHGERAKAIQLGEGQDVGWWLKDPPVAKFVKGKRVPLVILPESEEDLTLPEPCIAPDPPPPDAAGDSPARRTGGFTRKGSGDSKEADPSNAHGDGTQEEEDEDYVRTAKVTTELDRVPDHVLKHYEETVVHHRALAHEMAKTQRKNEGLRSKILRHKDPDLRRDYLSEFDHYETCYTLKRNLFAEGVVGAKPKPRFGVESVESPSWNRGSQKAGYNFTQGRRSRTGTLGRFLDDD